MDEIDAYINQIEQDVINFKKAVRAEEAKQVAEIKEKLAKDMAKKQDTVYTRLFKKVIKEYYGAYSPSYEGTTYKQLGKDGSGGLYKVLDLPDDETTDRSTLDVMSLVDGTQMSITKYSKYSGTFEQMQAPEELFRTTFEHGYHGGATTGSTNQIYGAHPNPGTPFWRKGGVVTAKNGHRWARWHVAAFQSEAPKDLFESAIQEAEDGEIQAYFIKTGTEYCQEVEKNIAAYANKLANETF